MALNVAEMTECIGTKIQVLRLLGGMRRIGMTGALQLGAIGWLAV
jgi:hypothetical protein